MSIIRKVAPRVGDATLQRVVDDIYRDLNEVAEQVQARTSVQEHSEGRTGDIRIVKQADDRYIVAIKAQDGWIVSTASTFTFQTKLD